MCAQFLNSSETFTKILYLQFSPKQKKKSDNFFVVFHFPPKANKQMNEFRIFTQSGENNKSGTHEVHSPIALFIGGFQPQ